MEAQGGGEVVQLLLIHDLALDGGEWSTSRPGSAFTPGGKNHRYQLYRRPQSRYGKRLEKNLLPLPGIEPRSSGLPVCSHTL
jgi:hypothetical protein